MYIMYRYLANLIILSPYHISYHIRSMILLVSVFGCLGNHISYHIRSMILLVSVFGCLGNHISYHIRSMILLVSINGCQGNHITCYLGLGNSFIFEIGCFVYKRLIKYILNKLIVVVSLLYNPLLVLVFQG